MRIICSGFTPPPPPLEMKYITQWTAIDKRLESMYFVKGENYFLKLQSLTTLKSIG